MIQTCVYVYALYLSYRWIRRWIHSTVTLYTGWARSLIIEDKLCWKYGWDFLFTHSLLFVLLKIPSLILRMKCCFLVNHKNDTNVCTCTHCIWAIAESGTGYTALLHCILGEPARLSLRTNCVESMAEIFYLHIVYCLFFWKFLV